MDSQNYADSILKTLREALLVLDSDHRVQTASPSFYRQFQVTAEQTVGFRIYDLGSHQWDIPRLHQLLEEVLPRDGEFNDLEVEHDFPNIGRRIMLLNARHLHDDGITTLVLLAIEDITERRLAESELSHQREWFQTMLSSIGDAVIATDTETRVTFMNPTAEHMTGWTISAAKGKTLEEVFHIVNEETRNKVASPVSKAIRLGAIVGLANHTLLIARDGSELPIDDSAAPIRDESGTIIGVVLVFHDITERRQAEKKIEASEARYRRLFEAAHDGILILDAANGQVEDVNRFLMDLLGHPREHFVGKQLWELGMFQDIEGSKNAMRELNERGYVRYENLPLMDRDGRQIPVEFVCNRYHEDGQQVFQCNIRDIRERQLVEREREALLAHEHAARVEAQASERANRAKDVFLATLSHEMRTPINAILGWATMLNRPGCKPEEVREGIEVIERNARAQAKLIEDVLDISRIVSGKLRLDVVPCDFKSIIFAAVNIVRSAADAKGITIDVEIDSALAENSINCDVDRMQQVIWNLLSNAVKFCSRNDKVKVAVKPENANIQITVSDNGPGISPQLLPYVFESFRQGDSSTTRRSGGLGLGLSIVRHLVELHGGRVQVQSQGEGTGSSFIVTLPVHYSIQGENRDAARFGGRATEFERNVIRLDGLHLMVVDDDPDARRLVTKVLQDAGANVTDTGSVREALRAMEAMENRESPLHLLISDLSMPEEDGFDLIRQIRKSGHTVSQLPAVALTAFADKKSARNALLAGYQVHVPKPVDPNDLIAVVATLTGRTGTSLSSPDA